MRLLFLNTSFPPMARSAAHLFHDLGSYFVKKGHQVRVVTELPWRRIGSGDITKKYEDARFSLKERMNGMDVLRVRGFPFREQSLMGRGINALLLPLTFYLGSWFSRQADVALVYSPPLTLGLASCILKGLHHIPFVFNVQDIYPQTLIELGLMKNPVLVGFFEWMERFIYRHASAIVAHSEGNRRYLLSRRYLHGEKVKVIHNWVDLDHISPSEGLNGFREQQGLGSEFVVCYAGTMGHAQDLNPVIEAARLLQDKRDIVFLLIGEGVMAATWRKQVRQHSLKNVRFLPLQPESVYPSIVAASDIGLVPLTEDLRTPVVPGKLMDFMAGARPVIATVHLEGDTRRIIEEAGCGFALSTKDTKGFAEAVLALHRDRDSGRDMGRNGRAYAERHFSLQACAYQYEKLFEKVRSSKKLEN